MPVEKGAMGHLMKKGKEEKDTAGKGDGTCGPSHSTKKQGKERTGGGRSAPK